MTGNLIYNREINIRNMLVFTVPTMIRMIFVSMYTIVDGIVVSNFVGSLGLSAINIVYPVLNVCMAIAFMLAAGSSAIMGEAGKEASRGQQLHEPHGHTNVSAIIVLTGFSLLRRTDIYAAGFR
ncbi:MAG: MATE family efflux transporter [Anaerovoracaceae bacterium]